MYKIYKTTTFLIIIILSTYATAFHVSYAGTERKDYPAGGAAKHFRWWVSEQLMLIKNGRAPLKPVLWVMPASSFAHSSRSKMVEITNSALAGALGPSMNSMLQQRYIILKDPALCRVVAVEGDSAISAIVRVIAIDTRTGAVDTFYTHCNFLQDAAELYRGTER